MYGLTKEQLIDIFGVDGEDPDYTRDDWKLDVEIGNTIEGYWECASRYRVSEPRPPVYGCSDDDLDGDITKDDL